MAHSYTCCICGGPASFGCAECCNTFCDANGCSAKHGRHSIHAHGALWAMQPIEPIPDDRVFKTGPLMRAAAPPRAPIAAKPKRSRLDLDSPSSVLEWMERERGGIPVRARLSPRRQGSAGRED